MAQTGEEPQKFHCPQCGSLKARAECVRIRDIQGLPLGRLLVYFKIKIHRLYGQTRHHRNFEHFHFLSSSNALITNKLEQRIIEERRKTQQIGIDEILELKNSD